MNCKACRVEIEELDESRALSRSAGAHLESCAGCRAFQAERDTLSRLVGSLEAVAAPADFDFRLRARLAAAKSVDARNGVWHRFAPGAWSMALAASFVILIALGLIVRQVWRAPSVSNRNQAVAHNNSVNGTAPTIIPSASPVKNDRDIQPKAAPANDLNLVQQAGTPTTSHRRNNTNRIGNEKPEATASVPDTNEDIRSTDFALGTPAPSIVPEGITDPVTGTKTMVAVPVQASRKSATVILNYVGAKPQMLSLRPVTFGAQDVFERSDAQRTLISSALGVW